MRHRHLQFGISSPVAVLAAATQRTRRIELGTAVTPLGWENPLRLAEDLATVDVLSGGRLNPGVSVGPPMHWDDVKAALYPDTADVEDFGYERVQRLLRFIARGAGHHVPRPRGRGRGVVGPGASRTRRGCARRIWYGGAACGRRSGPARTGMNLLTSSVVKAEESEDFAEIQAAQIRRFRAAHPAGEAARVSQGLVVIPTDSATADQKARYAAYVDARTPRTTSPQGPARMLFARDLLGTSDGDRRAALRARRFPGGREVVFALPFSFEPDDYVQILTDIAEQLGPALGWSAV